MSLTCLSNIYMYISVSQAHIIRLIKGLLLLYLLWGRFSWPSSLSLSTLNLNQITPPTLIHFFPLQPTFKIPKPCKLKVIDPGKSLHWFCFSLIVNLCHPSLLKEVHMFLLFLQVSYCYRVLFVQLSQKFHLLILLDSYINGNFWVKAYFACSACHLGQPLHSQISISG